MKRTCFRPLSWGLSFNRRRETPDGAEIRTVFVPFLGDFLSIWGTSSALLRLQSVFVPFLGDFLSITSLR